LLTAASLVDHSAEALKEVFRATHESFATANSMFHQIHTYTELRKQIHDDLRIQHPEWIEPNGESSMRLMELLEALTRRATNKSIAVVHRVREQASN